MKLSVSSISRLVFPILFVQKPRAPLQCRQQWLPVLLPSGLFTAAAIAATVPLAAIAMEPPALQVAQAPTPLLPPIPYASTGSPFPSEQYVVFINGNSDLLLEQVRQIAPDAFVTRFDGSSVIQVGRFNSVQNAQLRADELARFGIRAQVQPTAFTSAPIAVSPSADYPAAIPINATASIAGDLPPLPVAATPPAFEFGQESPFQTPPLPASVYPTNVTPPAPSSVTAEPQSDSTGYYVVLPSRSNDLPGLANQVIDLGAPRSLVKMRTAPRGPHIAVGPYSDYGIASEWSHYLRDAGLLNARVHFE